MGQGQKGKRPPTYGLQVKARVKRLLEALLSYFNREVEGCEHLEIESKWQTDNQVVVRTKSGTLEKLTAQDSYSGKLTKGQIGEALHKYLGSFLGILEDQRTQTKGSEDLHFTLKLWHGTDKNKNLAQFDKEWESRRSKKSKAQEVALTSISQKSIALNKPLEPQLDQSLRLYLAKSFNDDGFAELDQAGETDPERRTLLKQVFIDLDIAPCKPQRPQGIDLETFLSSSAMTCLLNDYCLKVVIIGGPGQGKSTLGQQLAQVHRAKLLGKPYDFEPRIERIPFRVVLKYFAQWLADNPALDDMESYLAERIGKLAARAGTVSQKDIQEILRCRPCLLILDGLDEVVVPELQESMLARIQDFLDRAEQLSANLMVVATSRPKEYKERYEKYFDPEQFWHLELRRLSPEKVIEYSRKWVPEKNLREEEQHRILRTLEECQQDRSISALLTTPLQVTIILLIIKDGGSPPSQREALFDEYWRIIFRREKSKAKGIIQSDESILFELHSYLGYLLHQRASKKNVQSLLSEEEFKLAIRKFLRREDSRSSEDAINSRLNQLVGEAQERLVLIVAPEPGLFGFELRSFQEFFAAVHLAQTAADTQQRFNRLKAIACSEHWRNVALFFTGRIVRNFKGEASNILELVCRPVDRGEPNRYLRPGCWLALEIAVDGALSTNRDLQYNAVEYGLEVLDTGLIKEQYEELSSLTERLSKEDQHDILFPVLTEKLNSLPTGCLATALKLYVQHFGTTPLFLDKIDTLLQTQQKNTVLSALRLALNHESEPLWMIERLQIYCNYWQENCSELWDFANEAIWFTHTEYIKKIFRVWQFSEIQSIKLAEAIHESYIYYENNRFDWEYQEPEYNLSSPKTLSDQLITLLECSYIKLCLMYDLSKNSYILRGKNYKIKLENFQNDSLISSYNFLTENLKILLRTSPLEPWLEVSLWELYWFINEPNLDNIHTFLERSRLSLENSLNNDIFWNRCNLEGIWPLLHLLIQKQNGREFEEARRLIPFALKDIQISIKKKLMDMLTLYQEQSEEQKLKIFIATVTGVGLDEFWSELVPLASEMGLSCYELLSTYIQTYQIFSSGDDYEIECDTTQLINLIKATKRTLEQDNRQTKTEIRNSLWCLMSLKLPDDPEIFRQLRVILELILADYLKYSDSRFTDFCFGNIVGLFLKLLVSENQAQQIVICFFTTLAPEIFFKIDYWHFYRISNPNYWFVLSSFLNHEEEVVRIGSAILLKRLKDSKRIDQKLRDRELKELENICLDTDWAWSFVNHDNNHRLIGITLLSLSDYPVEDDDYRHRLLATLQQPRTAEEDIAWAKLLKAIPMHNKKHAIWNSFLEEILAKPWSYNNLVLSAAMERYQTLASATDSTISEAKEKELGLP
jgi:hypothetical protein